MPILNDMYITYLGTKHPGYNNMQRAVRLVRLERFSRRLHGFFFFMCQTILK